MSDSIYVLYKHTDPDGKSYIGITNDYHQRSLNHKASAVTGHGCPAFIEGIRKYGWDAFTHTILAESMTDEEAREMEVWAINHYNTRYPAGYNLAEGGGKVGCISSRPTLYARVEGYRQSRIDKRMRSQLKETLKEIERLSRRPVLSKAALSRAARGVNALANRARNVDTLSHIIVWVEARRMLSQLRTLNKPQNLPQNQKDTILQLHKKLMWWLSNAAV